ncbi:MAG: beta-ketoacyl synthase N-terminal-like domain-containing protein, partial [Alphaproteobacteria bacterium]|nr:beta-ketoacyl synthase N-terminal-like domain-containing protein [Alphaproteobacteria bacterium]
MRRVAVTGLGIVSPIGANATEVTDSLKAGRSGIVHADVYEEIGFRSHVHGAPDVDFD